MKTWEDISSRIREGRAVVVTASQMKEIVRETGTRSASMKVDVVTTGTFAPCAPAGRCSTSGIPRRGSSSGPPV